MKQVGIRDFHPGTRNCWQDDNQARENNTRKSQLMQGCSMGMRITSLRVETYWFEIYCEMSSIVLYGGKPARR
jgi:hypothetical protein